MRPRDRKIWVRRRCGSAAFTTAARNIASSKDEYALRHGSGSQPPGYIDDIWARYESHLPEALDQLINSCDEASVPAAPWLRILVPFATAVFARGREFARQFETYPPISEVADLFDPGWLHDNTNAMRVMRLQRLLAPVMAARWIVMHTNEDETVITNDLCYTMFLLPNTTTRALALPIGLNAVLALVLAPQMTSCLTQVGPPGAG